MRIRHYGFLANRGRKNAVARCRELLGAAALSDNDKPLNLSEWLQQILGIDADACPCCGAPLRRQELYPLPNYRALLSTTDAWDTS